MTTPATTTTERWEPAWRRVRRLARRLGYAARMCIRERSIVVAVHDGKRRVFASAASFTGFRGLLRGEDNTPSRTSWGEPGKAAALERAIDLALSELTRIAATRRQWIGGLN